MPNAYRYIHPSVCFCCSGLLGSTAFPLSSTGYLCFITGLLKWWIVQLCNLCLEWRGFEKNPVSDVFTRLNYRLNGLCLPPAAGEGAEMDALYINLIGRGFMGHVPLHSAEPWHPNPGDGSRGRYMHRWVLMCCAKYGSPFKLHSSSVGKTCVTSHLSHYSCTEHFYLAAQHMTSLLKCACKCNKFKYKFRILYNWFVIIWGHWKPPFDRTK